MYIIRRCPIKKKEADDGGKKTNSPMEERLTPY